MSDETTAVDGANPAAPVSNEIQETPQTPAIAEGQEPEAKPDDKARDEKGRFAQERINELTKARRQAERERDALAAEVQQFRQQAQTPQSTKPPAFEDYGDLTQWGAAMTDYAVHAAQAQAERKFSEQAQQKTQESLYGTFEVREREYSAKHPDYAEAYSSLQSSVRFDPSVLEVIASSDHGPGIVHFLGEHLDAADRIQRMPPHLAAAEIARIEAQVKAPKPKPVTNAPNPPPTLGTGKANAVKDPDQMTQGEWLAWRNSQLK